MSIVANTQLSIYTATAAVFTIVSEVCAKNGLTWHLTSNFRPGAKVAGTDQASKHASAYAWDFQFMVRLKRPDGGYRLRWARDDEHDAIAGRLKIRLGDDFDVLSHKGADSDLRKHVHIEWDPKDDEGSH